MYTDYSTTPITVYLSCIGLLGWGDYFITVSKRSIVFNSGSSENANLYFTNLFSKQHCCCDIWKKTTFYLKDVSGYFLKKLEVTK